MDEEEVDWEVDEEQSARRASMYAAAGGDDGDADDAVSLGPDDDDPDYYLQDKGAHDMGPGTPLSQTGPSTPRQSDTALPSQPFSRENSATNGGATASPQRSLAQKGIHGLPPKPPAAVSFNALRSSKHTTSAMARVPPSHPKTKSVSGNSSSGKPLSSADEPPLPPGWQIRTAQSQQGAIYYYNTLTHVTQWDRPVRLIFSS